MSDQGVLSGVIPAVVIVVVYVWTAASLSAVFAKAGDQGWKAWVPILNLAVLLRLAAQSGWLVLLLLLPVLGWIAFFVIWIVACHRVTKAFGGGAGMTVLAVLVFPVWSSILGWGSAHWLGTEHGGPLRRGTTAPPLDARVAPADAPIPARPPAPAPPAPAAGVPIAVAAVSPTPAPPAPAPPSPASPTPPPPAPVGAQPVAALAASGWVPGAGSLDEVEDTDLPRGRSHAPYTQTVPTSFTPPADAPPPPAAPRRAFAPQPADAGGATAPVQDVPAAPQSTAGADPWAPPLAVGAAAGAARATRYSPPPNAEMQFETSAEVSAVAGAPTLGEPRSARESVSAQHSDAAVPAADAAFDETVIAARRRPAWLLTPPLGAPIAVRSDTLIIGRRPGADPDFADAQLIPISDETRTMSKTHARLHLQDGVWMIVDLDSTNGSILLGADGSEIDIEPGALQPATERFLLGDAELRLARKPDSE